MYVVPLAANGPGLLRASGTQRPITALRVTPCVRDLTAPLSCAVLGYRRVNAAWLICLCRGTLGGCTLAQPLGVSNPPPLSPRWMGNLPMLQGERGAWPNPHLLYHTQAYQGGTQSWRALMSVQVMLLPLGRQHGTQRWWRSDQSQETAESDVFVPPPASPSREGPPPWSKAAAESR